ncbi:solute carrier family 15 member 2-like [Cloeon dipterum]|uniref:solute carrier family 15 member 2-like n=1 Tax=Cloeon dipterum TaxID=197152 RepID=UPI00322048ED
MSDRIIDSPRKSQKGYSKVRLVMNAKLRNVPVIVNLSGKRSGSKYSFFFTGEISASDIKELENDEYDVQIAVVNNTQLGSVVFGTGGVYTMVLNEEKRSFAVTTITPENYVSVLWLIPQYFLMACSEILYAITGLGFAFSQSPRSMKTMIMSGLLTSVAFGNVIVIAISGAQICKDAVWEILIYAGIMFLCMIVFSIQAMWYQYAVIPPEDDFIMETNGEDGSSAKKNKEVNINWLKAKIISATKGKYFN